jgi:hypothetical protein
VPGSQCLTSHSYPMRPVFQADGKDQRSTSCSVHLDRSIVWLHEAPLIGTPGACLAVLLFPSHQHSHVDLQIPFRLPSVEKDCTQGSFPSLCRITFDNRSKHGFPEIPNSSLFRDRHPRRTRGRIYKRLSFLGVRDRKLVDTRLTNMNSKYILLRRFSGRAVSRRLLIRLTNLSFGALLGGFE